MITTKERISKWDQRFMDLAHAVSLWSKDPSTKVGAVVVDDKRRVVGIGYNGFPRGMHDDHRLQDRALKYPFIVHAEENALLNCFSMHDRQGATLYVTPLAPCVNCAKTIVQAGIARVVSYASPEHDNRWASEHVLASIVFQEAGVQLDIYRRPGL